MIVKMAELSKGEVMYFSQDPASSVIAAHQEQDGRSIIVSPSVITLKQGKSDKLLIPIPPVVQNSALDWAPDLSLAAAIGAAWALDIPFNVIEAGVETFVSNSHPPAGN
jgi:cyanophycin synthetase